MFLFLHQLPFKRRIPSMFGVWSCVLVLLDLWLNGRNLGMGVFVFVGSVGKIKKQTWTTNILIIICTYRRKLLSKSPLMMFCSFLSQLFQLWSNGPLGSSAPPPVRLFSSFSLNRNSFRTEVTVGSVSAAGLYWLWGRMSMKNIRRKTFILCRKV